LPGSFFDEIKNTALTMNAWQNAGRRKTWKILAPKRQYPGTGGWFVATDPKRATGEVIPLWHPKYVPTTVMLTAAPKGTGPSIALDPTLQAEAIAQWEADDGLHLRLPGGHQLWLLDKSPGTPLAVIIPLDENFVLRAAGAVSFRRFLVDRKASSAPRAQHLTPQQRARLVQMLRGLDGSSADASYREIASVLFGPDVTSDTGWKTHPIRAKTIRLVKDGFLMMNRGYLQLLQRRSAS
jgi:hypothetical protein